MERLTEKYNDSYVTKKYFTSNTIMEDSYKAVQKLGKLEDSQEEIECPLEAMIAAFKAVRQGFIFVDLGHGLYEETYIRLDYGDISPDEEGYIGCNFTTNYHYILDDDGCVFVEDYKKTWWLKADRSE